MPDEFGFSDLHYSRVDLLLVFFQSLQSLLQFKAAPEVLQQIVFWLVGSLLKAPRTSVKVIFTVFVKRCMEADLIAPR